MAEFTVKDDSILKFDFYFVDGDTRTQTINYGRSDVTTAEVRELQTLIRNGNLLIGDKNQATFGKISKVTHTARRTVTIPAERPLGVYTMDDVNQIALLRLPDTSIRKTYDIVNDEVTIPAGDLAADVTYTNVIGFLLPRPTMEPTPPYTLTLKGTLPGSGINGYREFYESGYIGILGFRMTGGGVASDKNTTLVLTAGNKSCTIKINNVTQINNVDVSRTYDDSLF